MKKRRVFRAGLRLSGAIVAAIVGLGIVLPGPVVGADSTASTTTGTRGSNTPSVSLEWYWAAFGYSIGDAGMVIADVDGDSDLEMVTTAKGPRGVFGDHYWYVFDHDGLGYRMIHADFPYDDEIRGLAAANLDGDRPMEIIVVLDGRVVVYDGRSYAIEDDRSIAPSDVKGFAVADIDDDSSADAVLCNANATWVYDLRTWSSQLYLPGRGCVDLAVGEVDGSIGREIVIANGNDAGLVIDAETGSVEWSHPSGFGDVVTLGDLDGDMVEEIVAGFEDDEIQAWNGDTHDLVWVRPVGRLDNVITGDVEGGGKTDVVYGDRLWMDLVVLDGANGIPKWSVQNPDDGFTGIAIGDLDEDGIREVFFGGGYYSSGEDHLHVVDTVAHSFTWSSDDIIGPFSGFVSGDVDADGERELVYTCVASNSWYGGGHYFVHDAATKEPEYRSPQIWENWTGVWDIGLADSDGDPELEIFFPTSQLYAGVLQARDGGNHGVQWQATLASGTTFGSLEIADPDRDGTLEVVAGSDVQNTGADGVFVYLYDAETGTLEWQSSDLTSVLGFFADLRMLRVSDIDGDNVDEILVAKMLDDLVALDPVGNSIDMTTDGLRVTAFETVDLDFDGTDDIVVGTDDGLLRTVNPATGTPTTIGGPYVDAIEGLAVVDLTGDGVHDFVFASADRVHIVDGRTMLPVWVSDDIGDDVGRWDGVVVADLEGDGRMEIWVNAGEIGHAVFEVATTGSLVFRDGFERGDTSAWSATVP